MATGANISELYGKETLTASHPHCDPYGMPPEGIPIRFEYPGKLPESQVLAPLQIEFCKLDKQLEDSSPQIDIHSNAFILADNFIGLHAILASGVKPKLIYLDPPYGTGLDFQSRDLEHAYKDTLRPTQYVEFMRRRLILMREILADDGSIYVHIGHQMISHMKVLMDEVFGVKNFRNLITRRKCSSKNFTKNQYSNIHDYVLFYSKSSSYIWNQPGIRPDDDWINKEYPKTDTKGRYKLVPIHAPGIRRGETGSPWRGQLPPPGKHWQYQPSKLDELDEAGEIHWSKNGNPRRKVYLTNDKMVSLSDYWDAYRDAHHQSICITGYPTEKNINMLKMIIEASSNKGDLVLDPFCGSGTTMHAAEMVGRRWIGIDTSFLAAKTIFNRLNHGLKPMGDYVLRSESAIPKDGLLLFNPEELDATDTPKHPAIDYTFYYDKWLEEIHKTEIEDIKNAYRSV